MNLKKMLFKQPNLNEGYNPKSPAEKNAKDIWDKREGSVIVQNHNLRRLNIGQLAVNLILVGAIAFLATKSSVQPFVVFANPENGEVWHVGTAQEAKNFEPSESIKKYFMANFIKKIREIPLDPVVRSQNLTTGFSFMTRSAATKLQSQLQNEKVQEMVGKKTSSRSRCAGPRRATASARTRRTSRRTRASSPSRPSRAMTRSRWPSTRLASTSPISTGRRMRRLSTLIKINLRRPLPSRQASRNEVLHLG